MEPSAPRRRIEAAVNSREDTAVAWLAAACAALIPVGWPPLPANIAPGDLLVPVLLGAAIAAGWRYRPHRLDAAVAAFIFTSLASVPGSLSPQASLLTVAKEVYLAGLYLAVAAAAERTTPEWLCRWLAASAAGVSAASFVAAIVFLVTGIPLLGEPMPLPYIGNVFRAQGLLPTPEFFGNLLTCAAPLLLLFSVQSDGGWRWTLGLMATLGAELTTFSKSIGGCAAALVMAAWPLLRERPAVKSALAAGVVTLVLVFNVMAFATIRKVEVAFGQDASVPAPAYGYVNQRAAADRIDVRVSYSPMSYYLAKKAAWTAFRRQPWTGIGNGAFPVEAERAVSEGRLHAPHHHIAPHSTPVGRLAETGMIGLAGLIVFVGVFWASGLSAARHSSSGTLEWALLSGALGLFINSVNVDMMHFRFFWFAAGIVRFSSASRRLRAPLPIWSAR
jgi:O-antigen ligase/polysaccharide polymerase Wzy-like membrane protein